MESSWRVVCLVVSCSVPGSSLAERPPGASAAREERAGLAAGGVALRWGDQAGQLPVVTDGSSLAGVVVEGRRPRPAGAGVLPVFSGSGRSQTDVTARRAERIVTVSRATQVTYGSSQAEQAKCDVPFVTGGDEP